MSNYVCWLCEKKEDRKSNLKYHMSSVHDRLKVICSWCEGKELSFRKAVDLKAHMKSNHKSIMRDAPADCFGEPSCFWLTKNPKDYVRVIRPTKWDSSDARFLRRAVEKWWPTVKSRVTKTLAEWKEGWNSSGELLLSQSPSPVLDFEDRHIPARLMIHHLTIGSDKVIAMLYEEFKNKILWHRITIDPKVLTTQRDATSLLRRMDQIKPFRGVIPKKFGKPLEGDHLKFARERLHYSLGIGAEYLATICKKEYASYSEDTEETSEPVKKKFKASHTASSNDLSEDGKLKGKEEGKQSSEIKRSDNGPKDAARTSKTSRKNQRKALRSPQLD